MNPTRGERAAAAAWALPTFRLQLFSYLDTKTLKAAMLISRSSFEEAVKVLYRAVNHEETLKMPSEGVDIARKLHYTTAIRRIDDIRIGPSSVRRNSWVLFFTSLLAMYPNLRTIGKPNFDQPVLRVKRSGVDIQEAAVLIEIDGSYIITPFSTAPWKLSPSLAPARQILSIQCGPSYGSNDIVNDWADHTGIFGGDVALFECNGSSSTIHVWTGAFERHRAIPHTGEVSIRIAWGKDTKRGRITRLFQAGDGKIDKLSVQHQRNFPYPPTWLQVLLAIADADLRHMREIELWTDCIPPPEHPQLEDEGENGCRILRNVNLPAPLSQYSSIRQWTDSSSRHHLHALTIHIYASAKEAPHLLSAMTELSHALLEAGGSTCSFKVVQERMDGLGDAGLPGHPRSHAQGRDGSDY